MLFRSGAAVISVEEEGNIEIPSVLHSDGSRWCHVTVHKPDSTAERLRFSLKTRDIEKARARRDKIFASIQQHFGIAA